MSLLQKGSFVSKPLPTFHDVLLARRTIAPYLAPTPLHHYPQLDALLDATVFVKHENYQPIGAFKVRGGVNFMVHLAPEERARGVVTASTGNHGQSVAYAAQLFGVRAVIVVPEGANPVKVQAMRAYGAEVVFHGADFEASKRHCLTLEKEQGLRFISSGDAPLQLAGVATHTLEILEAQPDIDVIFVPVGGGSGCAGACLVAPPNQPHLQVLGVAATGAPREQRPEARHVHGVVTIRLQQVVHEGGYQRGDRGPRQPDHRADVRRGGDRRTRRLPELADTHRTDCTHCDTRRWPRHRGPFPDATANPVGTSG